MVQTILKIPVKFLLLVRCEWHTKYMVIDDTRLCQAVNINYYLTLSSTSNSIDQIIHLFILQRFESNFKRLN